MNCLRQRMSINCKSWVRTCIFYQFLTDLSLEFAFNTPEITISLTIRCISLIEQVLDLENTASPEEKESLEYEEFKYGLVRCRYMLIYELTRYAILCSERDDQEKALCLLKRAEEFYHSHDSQDIEAPTGFSPLLSELDSLNPQKSSEMFTYVLFYLGQVILLSTKEM